MAAVAWQETCNYVQAQYRIWAQALLTNMIAAGLVQTSDTGQANPSTLTIDTTAASVAGLKQEFGYFVFRFNDSLQSSYPVYLRLSLGSYSYSTIASHKRPFLGITVGFATDGAGNITGPSRTVTDIGDLGTGYAHTALAGPHSSWCHHKEGFLALIAYRSCIRVAITTNPIMDQPLNHLVIERTRDSSGNPTGDGIYMLGRGVMFFSTVSYNLNLTLLSTQYAYFPQLETVFLSPGVTNSSRWGAIWLGGAEANAKAGAAQLQDIFAPHNGMTAFKGVKMYNASMAAPGDTADITVDGVTKRFLFAGSLAFMGELRSVDTTEQIYQRMGLAIEWAA